jgi:hypothetical protein
MNGDIELSHPITLPVCPPSVSNGELLPLHTVPDAPVTPPPTEAAETVTVIGIAVVD